MLNENMIATMVTENIVTHTFRRLTPDKKERIYRTALKLFGEFGYDSLAIDDLCRQAGISKGSFFQYFPSKSHLLEFVVLIFDDYLQQWIISLRRNEKAVLARDRIKYLYQALFLESRLPPDEEKFYLFITHAMNHSALVIEGLDLQRHVREYLREIVERGVKTGEIRGDITVNLTARVVALLFGALITSYYISPRLISPMSVELFVSVLFDGIRT